MSLLYGESFGTVQLSTIHMEVLPSRFLLLVFVEAEYDNNNNNNNNNNILLSFISYSSHKNASDVTSKS